MLAFIQDLFKSRVTTALRPPGAAAEKKLLATCVKCGRCMEVCPYRSIYLAPHHLFTLYGTPLIDPHKKPCYLCMKCPQVCPTGALTPVKKDTVAMGLAGLVKQTCLSYLDTMCNLCYRHCPLKGDAIRLDDELRPVIIEDGCVGCGVCYYVCPSKPKSIIFKKGSVL